jgi:hypothetical protein
VDHDEVVEAAVWLEAAELGGAALAAGGDVVDVAAGGRDVAAPTDNETPSANGMSARRTEGGEGAPPARARARKTAGAIGCGHLIIACQVSGIYGVGYVCSWPDRATERAISVEGRDQDRIGWRRA